MNKDDFSNALAADLGGWGDADGQALAAPLNNFFGDDFLTLLYQRSEPCPPFLSRARSQLMRVADRKTSRHERAAAAVALGRFMQVRYPNSYESMPGCSHPLDWFRLARQLNSVVGALALANILLAQRKLYVEFDLDSDPLPRLARTDALSEPGDLCIRSEISHAWYLGARVALRHVQRRFGGWDKEAFRCALACVVNYLTILPEHGPFHSPVLDRRVTLAWIKPLWNRLIQAASACEEDPQSHRGALIEQQLAILLHLDERQNNPSASGSRSRGPSRDRDESCGKDAPAVPKANEIIVVPGVIAESSDRSERDVLKVYEVLRKPVALACLPGLAELVAIRQTLAGEFPWASQALSVIMSDLLARRRHGVIRLGLAPVVLVGPPGTGKTRFAQRLSDLLGTPNTVINLAGMSDVKVLKGVTRGWASNRPSRMVEFIEQTKVANPLFVLDEIDKAGQGYGNGGDPQEALLDLLEPGNARRYQDIYLMTECDLSHCLYIATSNSLERLPEPLLSRLRPVFFPAPGPEHTEVIVRGVLGDMEKAWGLPAGTLTLTPRQLARLRGLAPRQVRRAVLACLGDEDCAGLYTLH